MQFEAAIAWGYALHEWQCESTVNKAKCVTHYLHRQMREAYTAEHFEKKGKKGNKSSDLASLLKAI